MTGWSSQVSSEVPYSLTYGPDGYAIGWGRQGNWETTVYVVLGYMSLLNKHTKNSNNNSKKHKENCDASLWPLPCVVLKLHKVTLSQSTRYIYPRISKVHHHWKGDSSTTYTLIFRAWNRFLVVLLVSPLEEVKSENHGSPSQSWRVSVSVQTCHMYGFPKDFI